MRHLDGRPPLSFQDLLLKGGYDLTTVRFLRHQEATASRGRTLYELWRDDRLEFARYGALHRENAHRSLVKAQYWATFVGLPQYEALFTGLYRATYVGLSTDDYVSPTNPDEISVSGSLHQYQLEPQDYLRDFEGRIIIKWGEWSQSSRTYFQLATGKDKPIIEIRREVKDDPFPGFGNFTAALSRIPSLPPTWIEVLRNTKGVYVLTCPRTRELYIGQATGDDGFFGRWMEYYETGHGGNYQLMRREPSDYQVAVLEVAGTTSDLYEMENAWKAKLQTKAMGLNSN